MKTQYRIPTLAEFTTGFKFYIYINDYKVKKTDDYIIQNAYIYIAATCTLPNNIVMESFLKDWLIYNLEKQYIIVKIN